MSEFVSLRHEIRHVVDGIERRGECWPTAAELYAQITRRASLQVFGVTLAQMLDAEQLRKRKAPGKLTQYGPGPAPVDDKHYRADRPGRAKGFMALKREREAKRHRGRA